MNNSTRNAIKVLKAALENDEHFRHEVESEIEDSITAIFPVSDQRSKEITQRILNRLLYAEHRQAPVG